MSKKRRSNRPELPEVVPHPRYGSAVRVSRYDIPEEIIRKAYWRYSQETYFSESAIPANPEKQNYSVFHRECYVDILKQCRDCNRHFLFFAEEQRYWYESLGFYVDCDCVRCCVCRKKDQHTKLRLRRHTELMRADSLNVRQAVTLTEDMIHLWKDGVIKDLGRLGQVKNIAVREIPTSKVTLEIVAMAKSAVAEAGGKPEG